MSVRDAELVLLGTGTSAGVPVIGCSCEVCTSTDPRDRRLRTGALLRFIDPTGEPREILIDCPPDHREQALRQGLTRCDGILFTHHHVDHTFGLDEVRRYNALMQRPIEIHADERTLEHLDRVYRHIFRASENLNDSFVATLVPRRIDAERPFNLFGLRVTPLRLLHGRVPVLGFRFDAPGSDPGSDPGSAPGSDPGSDPGSAPGSDPGSSSDDAAASSTDDRGESRPILPLAYCTDVNSIPPETWPHLRGLRTLVLDMLRYRSHPTHFTVDQAIDAAVRIGAERTWFVHMTHDILHADLDPRLPEGMRLGYDGLRIRSSGASETRPATEASVVEPAPAMAPEQARAR